MGNDELVRTAIVRGIKAGRTAWRRDGHLLSDAELAFRKVVRKGGNELRVILEADCARPTNPRQVVSLSIRAKQVIVATPSSTGGQHANGGDIGGFFLVDLGQGLGLEVLQGVLKLYGIPFSVQAARLPMMGHRSTEAGSGGA